MTASIIVAVLIIQTALFNNHTFSKFDEWGFLIEVSAVHNTQNSHIGVKSFSIVTEKQFFQSFPFAKHLKTISPKQPPPLKALAAAPAPNLDKALPCRSFKELRLADLE